MSTIQGDSLFRFIEREDLLTIRQLLQSGTINADERDAEGQTFLMAAAQKGSIRMVKEILEHPSTDVNAVDNDNWSALINAAKVGKEEMIKLLIHHGAVVNHKDVCYWTPLMWACYKGHLSCVKLLIDRGANVNVTGEHHMSCLMWAAGRGFQEIVEVLLAANARVNTADKYGSTPLLWASRKGYKNIVEILLNAEATVDNAGMYSWTALIAAAKYGYTDVAALLLQRDPNVNAVDKDGYTALAWASKEGHVEIVKLLLVKEAYVNIPDRNGDTVLILAVKGSHCEVVKALVKKYADVDTQGQDGKTALYWAVDKGSEDIVRRILDQNASLEIGNKDGDTPLLKAVRTRNYNIVKLLLDKGARVSAIDKRGDTSLHIAVRARSKRITELLLRHPKDCRLLYRPNKIGETPYNIDKSFDKSVLTQVFGTRNINALDNMQGYELYSSTLADVLSEPSLNTPITVGLFAKWGSGKSVLIDQLIKEMTTFTQQQERPQFVFSWPQCIVTLVFALATGVILGFTTHWYIALVSSVAVFVLPYILLGILKLAIELRPDWDWSYNLSTYIAEQWRWLRLLFCVLFCNEPVKSSADSGNVTFLFTDNAKLASVVGEKSITAMIGTLCRALEREYGIIVTRMYKAFKPRKAPRKFKTLCCVPQFIIVIFMSVCIVTEAALIVKYGINKWKIINRLAIDSIVTIIGAVFLVILLINIPTWCRALWGLVMSQKRRVDNIGKSIDSMKMEGFMQGLKREVELMAKMTNCMDGFMGTHTRLVVVVDGLDSCEQEKLLQVLDTLHMLFGDTGSPFITILAVDPHFIIKGIEANIAGKNVFHESAINGYDYLSNIVQLPIFLQGQLVFKRTMYNATVDTSGSTTYINDRNKERQGSVGISSSMQSVNDLRRLGKPPLSRHNTATVYTSTGDLSKNITKDSYFSDINPRSLRRLMNIVTVTARLLRAVGVDFSWTKLMSWIYITEQWPFRVSWMIIELETNENLDGGTPLKVLYESIRSKIPTKQDAEMDRNPRKLELFLKNTQMLTVADVRCFMMGTVNVDPYLRKIIREYQEAQDILNDHGVYATLTAKGDKLNNRRFVPLNRPPSNSRMTPQFRMLSPSPYQTVVVGGNTYAVSPVPDVSTSKDKLVKKRPKVKMTGGLPSDPLAVLSVDAVCNLLRRLEGLSTQKLPIYQSRIQDNNVSGAVLTTCDLTELKAALQMNFGDWELFKTLIIVLRERDDEEDSNSSSNESLSQVRHQEVVYHEPSGDKMEIETAPLAVKVPAKPAVNVNTLLVEPEPRMKRIDSAVYEVELAAGLFNQFIEMSGVEEQDEGVRLSPALYQHSIVNVPSEDVQNVSFTARHDQSTSGPLKGHTSESDSDGEMELQLLRRRGSRQSVPAEDTATLHGRHVTISQPILIPLRKESEPSIHTSQEQLRMLSRSDDVQGASAFRQVMPGTSRPPSVTSISKSETDL